MIDEEQKAWDMFAAAALQGMTTTPAEMSWIDAKTAAEYSANYADAMMEQRKARMG